MTPSGLRAVRLTLAVLLVASGTALAHADGVHDTHSVEPPEDTSRITAGVTASVGAFQTTNNSSQHEHPDRVDEEGNETAVARWFERQLSDRLEQSAVQLEQGEYELAESLLGEEYEELYGKYVDVAGEPGDTASGGGEATDADNTTQQFKTAQERQQEYASTLQRYTEIRQKYEEARQNGNETRARELARQLNRQQKRLSRTAMNLTASYEAVSNATGTNVSSVEEIINRTAANISAQQAKIRNETFTRTQLTIRRASETGSFQTPLRITGRLTAANGTPLASRPIQLGLGSQEMHTRTNDNGTFTTTLRPTVITQGRQTVTVHYRPQNTSFYLGTRTTVETNITQVTPTLTVAVESPTVHYNDTVTVTGTVQADNVRAPGVPVRITVGNTILGTTRTTTNGSFAVESALPARIPAGTATVTASIPLTGRALASLSTIESLTVATSPTHLTATRTRQSESLVRIAGQLTTADGSHVPDQPLRLRVDGDTIETVTTNTSGQYAITLNRSALRARTATDTINVTVLYQGTGNLNATQTDIVLDAPTTESAGLSVSSGFLLFVGLLGLSIVGGLATRRLDVFDRTSELAGPDATTVEEASTDDTIPNREVDRQVSDTLLEEARHLCDDGNTDAAILTAYEAARHSVTDWLELDTPHVDTQTHWEFYRVCKNRDSFGDDALDALELLTEGYEQARFTSDAATVETATEILEVAHTFLEFTARDDGASDGD